MLRIEDILTVYIYLSNASSMNDPILTVKGAAKSVGLVLAVKKPWPVLARPRHLSSCEEEQMGSVWLV